VTADAALKRGINWTTARSLLTCAILPV